MCCTERYKVLIIEPYFGGSHARLIETITAGFDTRSYVLVTMKAKKWHWRARSSALYISQQVPKSNEFKVMFCSSVLPLAELLGLRPDLLPLKKVVYFHENQLIYPVRNKKERDFQYGYNQITTCLAADIVLFNSDYNKQSFLNNIDSHLKLQPDYKIQGLSAVILPKCKVIYFPIDLNFMNRIKYQVETKLRTGPLHIIWPHRWEFDKNPDLFLQTVCRMKEEQLKFQVSILGESFSEKPEAFLQIKMKLGDNLHHCGFLDNPEDYYKIMMSGDVVVSTAIHEFFGVGVAEAVHCGCFPLLPNKLVYPEIFCKECLYNTDEELFLILKSWSSNKEVLDSLKQKINISMEKYESQKWLDNLKSIIAY